MGSVRFYRDPDYPYYQVNKCIHQSHASRKHAHAELAIALVTTGSSLFRFGEKEHRIHAGQLVMIGPEFVHQCCPEEVSSWSFYMVFIDPAWLNIPGIQAPDRPCFVVKDLGTPQFRNLSDHFESLCHPGAAKDETLLYIIDQALCEPENTLLSLDGADSGIEAAGRVSDHIREHLADLIRLDDLAELADMDKYMLIRCFSKAFNTTPHAWQLMLRMNEARRLLENGRTIADTALSVGFYDQSHFSRLFKESFGITPKRFMNPN